MFKSLVPLAILVSGVAAQGSDHILQRFLKINLFFLAQNLQSNRAFNIVNSQTGFLLDIFDAFTSELLHFSFIAHDIQVRVNATNSYPLW